MRAWAVIVTIFWLISMGGAGYFYYKNTGLRSEVDSSKSTASSAEKKYNELNDSVKATEAKLQALNLLNTKVIFVAKTDLDSKVVTQIGDLITDTKDSTLKKKYQAWVDAAADDTTALQAFMTSLTESIADDLNLKLEVSASSSEKKND